VSHLEIRYETLAVTPCVVVLDVLLDVLVLLELVPAENFEVVVPTLTWRDRKGANAILLEKVSAVVGPACPITKPWECTYATEALTSWSATLYS